MSEHRVPADLIKSAQHPTELALPEAPPVEAPWTKMHRRLRGRYIWAALLALVGAAGGAYLGWHSQEPTYRGQGLIYIAPSMQTADDPDGRNTLPMFQGFVQLQHRMLLSPRAAINAMQTNTWKESGVSMDVNEFLERRSAEHPRKSQHLQVYFEDVDPKIAMIGVHALIEAYQMLASDMNAADDRLEFAEAQVETLGSRLKTTAHQILTLTTEFGGVDGLSIQHAAALSQVIEYKQELEKLEGLIHDRQGGETDDKTLEARIRKPREIAVENSLMAQYLLELALLVAREEHLKGELGAENNTLLELRREIKVRRTRMTEFAEDWNQSREEGTISTGGDVTSIDKLRTTADRLEKYTDNLELKSARLNQIRVDVQRLENEREDLQFRVEQMKTFVDTLKEQLDEGRIKVPHMGALPTAPFSDRRVMYAALFGLCGAGLGVLLVLLAGLRDRRIKSAGQIDRGLSRLRLLGLVPFLPSNGDDREQAEVAGHCVHQIRTLLQIGHKPGRGSCVCISSPGVGSGKTTVSTALGLSFGNSGSHTLLVDADLSGRALTQRVAHLLLAQIRSRIEDAEQDPTPDPAEGVLVPALTGPDGSMPEPQVLVDLMSRSLEQLGLREAKDSGTLDDLFSLADLLYKSDVRDALASRLMDALESDGALTYSAPSEWIPARVVELSPGREAFNGTPLDRYVYRSGFDNVGFLPLRGLGLGGTVSADTIAQVLTRIREGFDVALFDTGPTPGAVETSMVAAHADSVVLVIAPDDHRPDAELAVSHLRDVGANIAGVVFNRAGRRDIERSSSRSSMRSMPTS